MFCNNCGHKIEGLERFCTQCGAPLETPAQVKKGGPLRWPKIVGIAGVLVAVVVIIALLIGGIGGTSSPEQTVRTFYREFERLNARGVVNLFYLEGEYEQQREMIEASLEYMYAMIDWVSISNLTVRITSQTGDTAEAVAEYDFTYAAKGGSTYSGQDEEDHFDLIRVGGRWLISDTGFLRD